ncbi:uncharacterized protein I303_108266 [Kwoniella dejecticola CBS 10117]|uniref:Manganese/iron superoxide dismutase C-terminal domain-containing protein n=1 Tax=Kwoniella dejecticola CBS 10117 TaxID=1296121 RepID=A0A1A5ZXV8_9TREE|nr:uncharacterized protein I303_07407 [Kwoniella dejecticola CBS 10117]OBR82645.1 hypothetical protein I303_07407 [Kwoniella dejecticola CBS 10117]
MSRPSTSFLRSALKASSSVPRSGIQARTVLNAASRSGINTSSIDYRILEGVNGFLPKENFDRLQEWQLGLWERLQGEVSNNPALIETKQKWDKYGLDMTDLISSTARDKELTLAYNYAALLLNNSFFLESLTSDNTHQIPSEFRDLQEKVEAYAEGIVGGGWLWIVRCGDSSADLDVIPTFASGTLLVSQRSQRGREGTLSLFAEPPTSGSTEPPTSTALEPQADDLTTAPLNKRSSKTYTHSNRLQYPSPLAVLNLHEHAYLGGKYGVWDKKQYASDWWKSLDWRKVQKRNAETAA